jgi:16S rRNA (guanine527-N7)-methyltransferase
VRVSTAEASRAADRSPRTLLTEGAAALQLELTGPHIDALLRYIDLLERWNSTYNLTSLRDRGAITTHHILDCLAAVPSLRRELTAGGGGRVLDVGSGAGLPGLIFGIVSADLDILCVDSVGKKTAFIRQAAAALGISNVQAVHARVESLETASFDVIAGRAYASLPTFVQSTRPLLSAQGCWMAMKGKLPTDEIDELTSPMTFHVEPLTVPFLNAERCLVWMLPEESERTLSLELAHGQREPAERRQH